MDVPRRHRHVFGIPTVTLRAEIAAAREIVRLLGIAQPRVDQAALAEKSGRRRIAAGDHAPADVGALDAWKRDRSAC